MGEKLGMIGLGQMGLALSRQMLADGHEICGYDVDPERMNMLKKEGSSTAASAKKVAERSDITPAASSRSTREKTRLDDGFHSQPTNHVVHPLHGVTL